MTELHHRIKIENDSMHSNITVHVWDSYEPVKIDTFDADKDLTVVLLGKEELEELIVALMYARKLKGWDSE